VAVTEIVDHTHAAVLKGDSDDGKVFPDTSIQTIFRAMNGQVYDFATYPVMEQVNEMASLTDDPSCAFLLVMNPMVFGDGASVDVSYREKRRHAALKGRLDLQGHGGIAAVETDHAD